MTRKSLDPDARKEEFLDAAKKLFEEKGFEETSIDDIVRRIGVAKGLFYYYFRSKDEIIDVLIERFQGEMRDSIEQLVQKDGLKAMDRLDALFKIFTEIRASSSSTISYFHKPQNRYLHLDLERRGLEFIAPAVESFIRQGVEEGIVHTEYPRETAISYLAVSSALGHRNPDTLTEEEIMHLVRAYQAITERLFGAEPGTFDIYWKHLEQRPPYSAVAPARRDQEGLH
jgi:AcrR family transcriptional regulator